MDHELTAKWHELDKVRVGLKDVVVLPSDLSPIQRQIGDLSALQTTSKDDLVSAINEVNEKASDVAYGEDAIETLAELGIVVPAQQDGTFYTSPTGEIYTI